MRKKIYAIRKTWYVIYLFGAVIFWTYEPTSIFTHWQNYLIVAVIVVLVDAFVFLSTYIKKLGHHELATDTKELLEENRDMMKSQQNKLKTFHYLLKNEPINIYYGDIEDYITGIQELLNAFGEKIDMIATIHSYATPKEKSFVMREITNRSAAQSVLERQEVFYSDQEKLALIPMILQEHSYVLKLKSADFVTEFDYLLFTSLISMYDLIYAPFEYEEDGDEV